MAVIQLMNLWLSGKVKECVPPLAKLRSNDIKQFDRKDVVLSKMRRFMAKVKDFGKAEGIWCQRTHDWDSAAITKA